MGEKLFRFRPVNNNSVEAFLKDELYASTADTFNDPYDSCFMCDYEKIYNLILQDIDLLNKFASVYSYLFKLDGEDVSPQEILIMYISNKKYGKELINRQIINFLNGLRRITLVCCFCKTIDKEIMWTHYASEGKGFALEYESDDIKLLMNNYVKDRKLKKHKDYNHCGFYDVKYKQKKDDETDVVFSNLKMLINSEFNSIGNLSCKTPIRYTKKAFKMLFLNKNINWKYEREKRLLLLNKKKLNQHNCIGKIKPKAIYLGEFMEFSDKYILCQIAREKNIPIYKMVSSLDVENFGINHIIMDNNEIDDILNKHIERVNFFKESHKKC